MSNATFASFQSKCISLNGYEETTHKCDYWIPPAPTPFPTERPTMPCPSCEETSAVTMVQSAAVGAVVALLLNWAVKKMMGGRDGYETLP